MTSSKRSRLTIGAGSVAIAVAIAVPALFTGIASGGTSSTGADAGPAAGTQACTPTKKLTIYGEKLPGGKFGYGLSPSTAAIPGPTIQMYEGECLAVTYVNHTGLRSGIHSHGVDYTVASDGTPLNDSCVNPGASRTYVIGAKAPTKRKDGTFTTGNAGYWHYHDHCMGTDHGTQGVDSGLFGALIVRRKGDLLPDRPPFVVVMNDLGINLQLAPDTPTFEANLGQRVEFVVISHGDSLHTFHLHGHRWADTRTGYLSAGDSPGTRLLDTRVIGPGDSFGFQVVAGEDVGPGAWMYHCHLQGHADAGMEGMLMVMKADGSMPPGMPMTLPAPTATPLAVGAHVHAHG